MRSIHQILGVLMLFIAAAVPQVASAKCVSRIGVVVDGKSSAAILAVAPDNGSSDLSAAGFVETACGNLDKSAYRTAVCNPGTIGNHGVQRQLEIQAGITFAQRCAAANAEAGLPAPPVDSQKMVLSPPNRRPAVPPGGPGLAGPLAGANQVLTSSAGN